MSIKSILERTPLPVGILLVHHSYDRFYNKIYAANISTSISSGITIALKYQQRFTNTTHHRFIIITITTIIREKVVEQLILEENRQYYFLLTNNKYSVYYSLICVNVIQTILTYLYLSSNYIWLLLLPLLSLLSLVNGNNRNRNNFESELVFIKTDRQGAFELFIIIIITAIVIKVLLERIRLNNNGIVPLFLIVVVVVSTVRSLYAGTLATIWTTAPSLSYRRNCSIQLAAVCLFLAILTITARCYAATTITNSTTISTTHRQLVQLKPNQSPLIYSRINDNFDARIHSSNLVLNRLLLVNSQQFVQSDTSVILINSTHLLHNQNSNEFRTKRELKSSILNYITNNQKFSKTFISAKDTTTPQSHNINNHKTTTQLNTGIVAKTSKRTKKRKKAVIEHLGINYKLNKLPFNDRERAILNLEKRSDTTEYVLSAKNKSVGVVGVQVDVSQVNNSLSEQEQQRSKSNFFEQQQDASLHSIRTERPMPPVHDHGNASSVSDLGILILVLSTIVLTVALGLVTCVLSHYRSVAGEGAAHGGTAGDPHDAARTPTSAPMLSVVSAGAAAGVGGMDRLRGGRAARELAATRDRQVRLHAVHTDIAINLPPSIEMPDGEEHPFTSSRLHLRDPEQESEIHQKCIRPPPNRTVLESESPPPYRSSSAGLLSSMSSSSSSSCSYSSSSSYGIGGSGGGGGGGGCNSDWSGGSAPLVVRCHSMSSTSKRPEAGSSGQKTDFLQRTVKILTGGGKRTVGTSNNTGIGGSHHHPHQQQQQQQEQSVPVVIVPTRPRRTSNDQYSNSNSSTGRPKPSV